MVRIISIAGLVTGLLFGGGAFAQTSTFEPGWNRPGQDYKDLVMDPGASPKDCMATCLQESACKAWTYVKPDVQVKDRAVCWLKSGVPEKVIPTRKDRKDCCTSGMKLSSNLSPADQCFVQLRDQIDRDQQTIQAFAPGFRQIESLIASYNDKTNLVVTLSFPEPGQDIAELRMKGDLSSTIKTAQDVVGVLNDTVGRLPDTIDPSLIQFTISAASKFLDIAAAIRENAEVRRMAPDKAWKIFQQVREMRHKRFEQLSAARHRYYCEILWPSEKRLFEWAGSGLQSVAKGCTADQRRRLQARIQKRPSSLNVVRYSWGGLSPREICR
jgi:hypothetical protein